MTEDIAPLGPVGDYAALADAAGKARQDANERFQQARADSETAALRELVFTAASYGVTRLLLEPSDQGDYMIVSEIEPDVEVEAEDYIGDAGSSDLSDYSYATWAGHDGVEVEEFSHRDDQIRKASIDVKVAAEALIAATPEEVEGVTVVVHRSGGSDNAVVVQIDTEFEPDASDGGPGLRVNVNDHTAYAGTPYAPTTD